LFYLGFCHKWAGHAQEAERAFRRLIQEIRPTLGVAAPVGNADVLAGLAYAGLGEKENALEQVRRGIKGWETNADLRPLAEGALAQIQAQVGDHDAALATLRHLLEVPGPLTTADLKLNPMWDPLRADPAFQKLCEEKGEFK
jgi:tetratricopeptide (TPR) repeat protein